MTDLSCQLPLADTSGGCISSVCRKCKTARNSDLTLVYCSTDNYYPPSTRGDATAPAVDGPRGKPLRDEAPDPPAKSLHDDAPHPLAKPVDAEFPVPPEPLAIPLHAGIPIPPLHADIPVPPAPPAWQLHAGFPVPHVVAAGVGTPPFGHGTGGQAAAKWSTTKHNHPPLPPAAGGVVGSVHAPHLDDAATHGRDSPVGTVGTWTTCKTKAPKKMVDFGMDLFTDLGCQKADGQDPGFCLSSVCRWCDLNTPGQKHPIMPRCPWLEPTPAVEADPPAEDLGVLTTCKMETTSDYVGFRKSFVTDLDCQKADGERPPFCVSSVCRWCSLVPSRQKDSGLVLCPWLAAEPPVETVASASTVGAWMTCKKTPDQKMVAKDLSLFTDRDCQKDLDGRSSFCASSVCRQCSVRATREDGAAFPLCPWVPATVSVKMDAPAVTVETTCNLKAPQYMLDSGLDLFTDLGCQNEASEQPNHCSSSMCRMCTTNSTQEGNADYPPCPRLAGEPVLAVEVPSTGEGEFSP